MILPISFTEVSGMKCREMAQASAAKGYGSNYELMFLHALDFRFRGLNMHKCIGSQFTFAAKTFEKDLKRYHGIEQMRYHRLWHGKGLDFIISSLDKNMPVACRIDQYYLPWAKTNRKKAPIRYDGYVLFVGYNGSKRELYCIDIHGSHRLETLPFYDFIQAFKIQSLKAAAYKKNGKVPEFNQEFFVKILRKQCDDYKDNLCKNILKLEMAVTKHFDFAREIEQTTKRKIVIAAPNRILCIDDFVEITRRHKLYAISLSYLAVNYKNQELLEAADELKLLSAEWQFIVSVLSKAYYQQDYTALNLKLGQKITEIAKTEAEVIKKLQSAAEKGFKAGKRTSDFNCDNSELKSSHKQCYADISEYCSNTGISELAGYAKADFDGMGNCYLMEQKLSEITCGDGNGHECLRIVFRMSTGLYDNIVCQSQMITVKPDYYDTVCLLGACDTGSFYGKFSVVYEDDSIRSFITGFGEWRFVKCEMGESAALVTDRFYKGIVSQNEKGYLFSQKILIEHDKKIKGIVLPNCENMHIFAITLLK